MNSIILIRVYKCQPVCVVLKEQNLKRKAKTKSPTPAQRNSTWESVIIVFNHFAQTKGLRWAPQAQPTRSLLQGSDGSTEIGRPLLVMRRQCCVVPPEASAPLLARVVLGIGLLQRAPGAALRFWGLPHHPGTQGFSTSCSLEVQSHLLRWSLQLL